MRLLSLRFRHVGTFGAEGVALEDLSAGLNVISETNEFGKSTILKALEVMLFKPFSSSDKQIKSLATDGSEQGPEGEITFESGGQSYHLKKRFLKKKLCELRDGAGQLIAESREADERLSALLNPDGYEAGPSGLLWVRQGESMSGIRDNGLVASRLEGELTTLVGGDRARNILTRVEADLAEIVTKTGKAKTGGPLKLAQDSLAETDAALELAKAERDRTQAIGIELTKVRDELARLMDDFDPTSNAVEIEAAREMIAKAKVYDGEIQTLIAKRDRAKDIAVRAAETQEAHIEALTKFHRWTEKLSELKAVQSAQKIELAEKQAEKARLSKEVAALQIQFDEFDKTRQAKAQADSLKLKLKQAGQDFARLSELIEVYDGLASQLARLDETLSALPPVRREDLSKLQQLSERVQRIEAEISALTTRLYLDLSTEGAGKISLGGKVLTSGPIELTGGDRLKIEGVGHLRSDDGNLQALRADRRDLEALLSESFELAGVTTMSEARLAADERHDLESERKRINQDMARLAPQGEQALRDDLNNTQAVMESLSDKLSELEAPMEDAGFGEDHSRAALTENRAKLDVLTEEVSKLLQSSAVAEAEIGNMTSNLSALRLPDSGSEREAEGDRISGEKLKAEAEAREAQSVLDKAQENAPAQSVDLLTSRLKRLETLARQTQDRLQELKQREASLTARRDAAFEGEDIEALVESLSAEHGVQMATLATLERRVAALTLLRDSLIDSQSRLREAYTGPVRAELAPLLAMVLPGAEAQLDEHLGANTVSRAGRVEDIGQLSGGTREQIAILTRLAFARLLKRGGADAPVILDDALVYADDVRRDTMFDVLNHVASGEDGLQLIYLSCHQDATRRLGGHRVTPQVWPAS